MDTEAICPSLTGTLMQVAEIMGTFAFCILSRLNSPQIFIGSFSLFSSSPPMNGITLSTISSQVRSVLPAPETACWVVTTTFEGPKLKRGVIRGTYDRMEQFGLTTINPFIL